MIRKSAMAILFLLFVKTSDVSAQACCSAGTPLMGPLETSPVSYKTWQFSISYNYNMLNDVIFESESIDGSRHRISQSAIMEASYGLSDRWSVSTLFSFMQHQRQLNEPNSENSLETLGTNGLGDALLLFKYTFLPLSILNQRQLAVGFGVKAPLGQANLSVGDVLLPADMQPGTGSWDVLLWGYFFQGFLPATTLNLFLNATLRYNGQNDRYDLDGFNNAGYRFGQELHIAAGVSYAIFDELQISLAVRNRMAGQDLFGDHEVANTGGHWIYLIPGINFNFSAYSLRISGQFPVYRRLNGIQLTTSYSINTGFYFMFNKR